MDEDLKKLMDEQAEIIKSLFAKDSEAQKNEIDGLKDQLFAIKSSIAEIERTKAVAKATSDELFERAERYYAKSEMINYLAANGNHNSAEILRKSIEVDQKNLIKDLDHSKDGDPTYELQKSELCEKYKIEKSAMATTTSGAGSQFLYTQYFSGLLNAILESAPVAKEFKSDFAVNGVANYKKKTNYLGAAANIWLAWGANISGENTANAVTSNIATGETTITTKDLTTYSEVSDKMLRNSFIDLIKEIRAEYIEAMSLQLDNAIVNGALSLTDVFVNGGSVAATSAVNLCNGLRQIGLAGSAKTALGSAFTLDGFRGVRELMKGAGDYPEKLVAFLSRGAYYGALDAIKLHSSVGDYQSTISGVIEKLDGVKVINGGYAMNFDLTTAAGKIDDATPNNNAKETALIVNPACFRIVTDTNGTKIMAPVWSAAKAQHQFSGILGVNFGQVQTANYAVGYLYNIT